MGYNTVLVVLNDNVDMGARDPHLGERILSAVRSWTRRRDRHELQFFARAPNGGAASYGEVISQDHANGYQVVIVHGNTGWRLDDPNLPEECLKALEQQLKWIKRDRKEAQTKGGAGAL